MGILLSQLGCFIIRNWTLLWNDQHTFLYLVGWSKLILFAWCLRKPFAGLITSNPWISMAVAVEIPLCAEDMLVGSSEQAKVRMTPQQSRTQFSLWSVMAAPLLIGSSMLLDVSLISKHIWNDDPNCFSLFFSGGLKPPTSCSLFCEWGGHWP